MGWKDFNIEHCLTGLQTTLLGEEMDAQTASIDRRCFKGSHFLMNA
uniref:Uncharacterized protein n=1 Tax=Picea glauca TaxID=3330 RepID=A0A117NGF0_PICGL|nr:hypothetical protein ABT39_MTgene1381 [Picea glauca]